MLPPQGLDILLVWKEVRVRVRVWRELGLLKESRTQRGTREGEDSRRTRESTIEGRFFVFYLAVGDDKEIITLKRKRNNYIKIRRLYWEFLNAPLPVFLSNPLKIIYRSFANTNIGHI